MTRPIDGDLETRLAAAFRAGDLPAAPGRLLDTLERVPDEALTDDPAAARDHGRGRGPRTTFWLVGIAAAVALGGAVLLGGGGRPSDPLPVPSQGPSGPLGTVLTYEIQWTVATPFDDASLARTVDVVQRRLDATGVVGATVRSLDRDHLEVAIPAGIDPDPFRRLVGQSGEVTFVPLGTDSANKGDMIDPANHPALFGGEGLAGARIGTDQTGSRVVEFDLTPVAASQFETYTATHIGEYFAIALDGRVVSAPVINSAIPGGHVQISQGGAAGGFPLEEAQELVTIVLGPLPAPIREVSIEGAPVGPSVASSPIAAPSD